MNDLISRQAVKDWLSKWEGYIDKDTIIRMQCRVIDIPSTQLEQLPDDDIETIRIHLEACKEKLCNQRRWAEAEEYQNIIDRFMAFASAQTKHGKWRWINKGWIWVIDDERGEDYNWRKENEID